MAAWVCGMSNRAKAKARLLQRGPSSCLLCGCSVSDAAQHNSGKRHQSNRFYGYNAVVHQLRDLRIPRELPTNVHQLHSEAPERVRPAEVPDRHVQTARVARELVLPLVTRHSGVQLHARVCQLLEPEPLCEAAFLFDRCWAAGSSETLLQLRGAGAAAVLCLAAQLRLRTDPAAEEPAGRRGGRPGRRRGEVLAAEVQVASPTDEVREIATSAALEVLATSLASARAPVRLALTLDATLGSRRLATLFVRATHALHHCAPAPLRSCASAPLLHRLRTASAPPLHRLCTTFAPPPPLCRCARCGPRCSQRRRSRSSASPRAAAPFARPTTLVLTCVLPYLWLGNTSSLCLPACVLASLRPR